MDKKYQIFISSTFTDLKEERKLAIFQILNIEHFPIGMELFKPSDTKQWNTIKKTIDSSDAYLLIVGFRYGSIDSETKKSYTEMEFEYALAKKIPISVYIMRDPRHKIEIEQLKSHHKNGHITFQELNDRLDSEFGSHYDFDQSNISAFRQRVLDGRIAKHFSTTIDCDPEDKFDISSAINEVVKNNPKGGWTQRKKTKWHFLMQPYFYVLFILLLLAGGGMYFSSGIGTLEYKLKSEHSLLFFSPKKNAPIEYARVIPDGNSLISETDLAGTIKSTDHNFCMLTNSFQALVDHEGVIDTCIVHGADFKILLIDTATEKIGNINGFAVYDLNDNDIETKRNKLIGDFINAVRIIGKAKAEVKKNAWKGDIHLKVFQGPMPFQMWIKDGQDTSGIAHYCSPYFDGFKGIFRVSARTSPRMIKHMADEFDKLWNDKTNKLIF